MQECKLLEGSFAWAVQFSLFCLALLALVIKRTFFENPKRTVQIWLMDIGKQCGAAGFAHILNILLAFLLSASEGANSDQCAWYFINYLVDTTLGIPIAWSFLQILQRVARGLDWSHLTTSGDYGNPPSYKTWIYQLLAWQFVLLIMKLSLGSVLYLFGQPLGEIGRMVFAPIQSPEAELVIVMVLCPALMNCIQFWIYDTVLKMQIKKAIDHADHQVEELLHIQQVKSDEDQEECPTPSRKQADQADQIQIDSLKSGGESAPQVEIVEMDLNHES